MNQCDQNINKDMIDSDLIDVDSMDFRDDQTWLCTVPNDSGEKVDIVDWNLSCDWPNTGDDEYLHLETLINGILDNIIKDQFYAYHEKHKFDSRTYVKPKKRPQRPSIQNIVEVTSNNPSMSPHISLNPSLNPAAAANSSANKYLTYNKYSAPFGPISPMLRLKTFNVDTNSENSHVVKEFAMKRRSFVDGHDDDPQLEDVDVTLASEVSGRLSMEHPPSKPINIDLSQPAHNLHNTFNKGLTNIMNERGSLNMYQSGESLMRMSPPSLVSSLMMESSGNFNPTSIESTENKKSLPTHRDSGPPPPTVRDSIDPMMTSMTLSILDEKDMSTSFLSQTTYPDNDSLIDSLPPSLVSSVNSSYVKPKDANDSNIFSSATFTHLEQSERLLSARPRVQLFNSFKRDSLRNSESYTKAKEEACQIDTVKVLNENTENKESPKPKVDMTETITLHFSNVNFTENEAEKENFVKDDAFYKDMGVPKPEDIGRNSLNVTLGKQELNEIIQARQKLSLARKALPSETEKPLPNQVNTSPVKTIHLPNQTITVPRQSMENASELLSRRRAMNGFDKEESTRETPKRNATFKKISPRGATGMDTTVIYPKDDFHNDKTMIDINSATMNLVDERTLQQEEWCLQERAMVGSNDSTDTGTFSSSSPPDTVPDTGAHAYERKQIASTPLVLRQGITTDLLNLHTTISPIYDNLDDNKSYTLTKAPSASNERTYNMHNATVINCATMIKKTSAKRDILAGKTTPDKISPVQNTSPPKRISPTAAVSYGSMMPPSAVPRKTNLPTSKLRQYSSHRELSRIPGGPLSSATGTGPVVPRGVAAVLGSAGSARSMVRRGVYASNPALSPTAPHPADILAHKIEDKPTRPTLMNPPALVRQGTETLRRERPQSQLIAPKDVRGSSSGVPVSMRNHHFPPPTSRPTSIAGVSQLRVMRPNSAAQQKSIPVMDQPRPASGSEPRISALPRPSRLPAPRRALRPPSVYSVTPTADAENY